MNAMTDVREIYMDGLHNAHDEERQAIETMQQRAERLERILGTHGTGGNAFKEGVTSAVGDIAALGHAAASDEVLENTFQGCALEHYEVVAYTSLAAMADTAGDQQHIPLLRQSLQEEAMAEFMEG